GFLRRRCYQIQLSRCLSCIFCCRNAAIETIYLRDLTITKFRELVQKLNEQRLDLRDRTANNDPKSVQDANGVKIAIEKMIISKCLPNRRRIQAPL
ncbi:unnamed protein product, partial [Ceratitis capitata]